MTQAEARWKWLLLSLCGVAFVVIVTFAGDQFGVGGRPWFGWWDSNFAMSGTRYVVTIVGATPNGATARAGLRDGDRIDLREQNLRARVEGVSQLMASQPLAVIVHRGSSTITAHPIGSTMFEGNVVWKIPAKATGVIWALCFLACAFLIALRRSSSFEGRVLALVLLAPIGDLLRIGGMVVPNALVTLGLNAVSALIEAAAMILLIHLASRYGERFAWRRVLEWCGYAAAGLQLLRALIADIGLSTLWFDPLPYLAPWVLAKGPYATALSTTLGLAGILVACVAIAAVATSKPTERPRTAWLLLPMPFAFAVVYVIQSELSLASSWLVYTALIGGYGAAWLLGALATTYALLRRRVLDFEFVLGRTIVVGAVSLIVVTAFVLLEWILGTALAGVSHLTGVIANAALALVLGVSLSYIHRAVDGFVDSLLFRKRRDDERALLAFSKEASFITDASALLDQTIERIERNTDARSAAILLDDDGRYGTARSFGADDSIDIGENDGAILALKAWHKPLDPHHYPTALRGALALPMLARGRLLGVMLLGERRGGEAYAPDEIEALTQLAHGVGSSFDALAAHGHTVDPTARAMLTELTSLREAISGLPEAIAARLTRG